MIIELRHIIGFLIIWVVPAWVTLFIIYPNYKKKGIPAFEFWLSFCFCIFFGMFFLVLIEKPPKDK